MSITRFKPPKRLTAAWLRRAITLKLKAEALLDDMVRQLGEEHELTDFADSVVQYADDLAEALTPRATQGETNQPSLAAKPQGFPDA